MLLPPRLLVQDVVHATGVFSSSSVTKKLGNVAFRVLSAEIFTKQYTLYDFRQQYLGDFESQFVKVVQSAQRAGLIQLGALVIDGAKVQDYISRRGRSKKGRQRYRNRKNEVAARIR